ncbi:hypothetical protein AAFN46_20520 [Pseudomonas sp. CAU 1711]|uniref:hypothetical protein n=1 Tax=Pseudomonas sp. CAU 1711 TaxID=3140356 RepID=UPI0032608A19
MHSIDDLLKRYEEYKNRIDAFHHSNNKYETQLDTYNALNSLRKIIEKELPPIAIKANTLSAEEFAYLFKANQTLYIDEYDYRLEIFELIVNPNADQIDTLEKFKTTITIT